MKPNPCPIQTLEHYRQAYARLHDLLAELIEGGRLCEVLASDDYEALVDQLSGPCAAADDKMADAMYLVNRGMELLTESTEAWGGEEDSVREEKWGLLTDLESFWQSCKMHGKSVGRPSARRI